MKIPPAPPLLGELFTVLKPDRLVAVVQPPLRSEVDGAYLHWEELRRKPAPDNLSHEEWWLRLEFARSVLKTALPLRDKAGVAFNFARADSLLRLLHGVDRDLGNQLELGDAQIANPETRDRYIIRSLAEEAITSSQLEGASATRKVAKEMLLSGRAPRSRGERMIANNFRAMELVRSKRDEQLSPELILELHEVLTEGTFDNPDDSGRFRTADEPISVQDLGTGDVLHVPPAAGELPERLVALCKFANQDADDAFIHPVVRAIVLHFALAFDHPFVDGNGRTARALFYWSMLRQRYWLTEFLSISRIIQKAPARYTQAFLFSESRGGDITYFLLHQLGVVRRAIDDMHTYLKKKAQEVREAERLMRAGHDWNQRQQLLIAHALRHPDARYTHEGYSNEYGVVYATARSDLMSLAKTGRLQVKKLGRRLYYLVPSDLAERLKGKASRAGAR